MLGINIQNISLLCKSYELFRVTADHSAASSLGKEAHRWATRIAREVGSIKENTLKLQIFQQLKESGQKVWNKCLKFC